MTTEKHIAALHKSLTGIPEADRDYAARFVKANAHKSPDELLAHWKQDSDDRQKAADIERHRKERVLSEFVGTFGKDAVAVLGGLAGNTATGETEGK